MIGKPSTTGDAVGLSNLKNKNGKIAPKGPGMGMEWNEKKVAQYSV